MIRYLRLIALGMVAVSAAGCTSPMSNGEEEAIPRAQHYPIVVEPHVVTMTVAVDDGLQRLAPGENERVRAFAERWKARGQGMINAAAPNGSSNRAAAMSGLDEVKHILRSLGVDSSAVTVSSYRADNDPRAPITLSFVTLAASAADCGLDWSKNLAFNPRNTPWPDFGCSTQHDFAALVADPRDLIEPRTSDPSDDMRRSQVLDKYRQGQPTETLRTTNDTGNVSSVATH